jgi:hypothetical protein
VCDGMCQELGTGATDLAGTLLGANVFRGATATRGAGTACGRPAVRSRGAGEWLEELLTSRVGTTARPWKSPARAVAAIPGRP